MLIRSQNKEILANMEGPIAIEILSDGKGHATMYWKDSYALGTYSSKEKAIKVRFVWKNAPSLSKQSVRQNVEKSTVIT